MSTHRDNCIARIREALAEDSRTNALDLEVSIRDGRVILRGPVETPDRRIDVEVVARGVCEDLPVVNEMWVAEHRPVRVDSDLAKVRIGAVGDLHVSRDAEGLLRLRLTTIGKQADVLLLAGDLTQHGDVDEGRVLASELEGLPVPIVAVLGNHDYHRGQEKTIRRLLEDVGVTVLEAEHTVLPIAGQRVGIAGVKGFGSGFAGACASEFGEEEMKIFVRHAKRQSEALYQQLVAMDADLRIALTHYAPVADTLEGERREIYPFLGSYLLGQAIDAAGCDLAVHGHAHKGKELGTTASGIPVRNVALPVIGVAYRVYMLDRRSHALSRAVTVPPPIPV